MDADLFNVLSELEIQAQKEREQNLPAAERMLAIDPEAGKFISMLAVAKKAQNIVEVGSGVGYSTLWLAYAASITGGRVISCELDPTRADRARANITRARLADFVEILTGDARELLRHRTEPVDFVFIDGAKDQYETYFDVLYKRLELGAIIVADNVLSHEDQLLDYITYVQNHPNLESVTIPLGMGLEITVKTAG